MQQSLGQPVTHVLITKGDIVINLTKNQVASLQQALTIGAEIFTVNGSTVNIQNDLRGIYPMETFRSSGLAKRVREGESKILQSKQCDYQKLTESERLSGMERLRKAAADAGLVELSSRSFVDKTNE